MTGGKFFSRTASVSTAIECQEAIRNRTEWSARCHQCVFGSSRVRSAIRQTTAAKGATLIEPENCWN